MNRFLRRVRGRSQRARTKHGIRTMLLIAVPVTVVFLAGLDLLWLYSLGGRRVPGRPEPADQQRRPSSRVPRVV